MLKLWLDWTNQNKQKDYRQQNDKRNWQEPRRATDSLANITAYVLWRRL